MALTREEDEMSEREKMYPPGPWEMVDYDDFEEAPVVGVRMRDVLGGYHAVAAIHDQGEQTEANAHLIAAAPTLLEALEEAREWIDGCGAQGGVDDILHAVDVAIDKAYGDTE